MDAGLERACTSHALGRALPGHSLQADWVGGGGVIKGGAVVDPVAYGLNESVLVPAA